MAIKTRLIVNTATGETETIEVDNAYILARQSNTILLSANLLQVATNGTITLTAHLRTPELADYSYQDLTDNRPIKLQLGDTVTTVNLVNGLWSDSLQFVVAGSFEILCLDLPSNSLIIEVI